MNVRQNIRYKQLRVFMYVQTPTVHLFNDKNTGIKLDP